MAEHHQRDTGHTRGAQAKCAPGTLKDVMSIVTHRNKKTDPVRAKKRRIKMNLIRAKILNDDYFKPNREHTCACGKSRQESMS